MVRKLVWPLLLALVVPGTGWALGLGDIRVHSGLNEPLDAEIELLSVDPGEDKGMKVSLAPYEAFARVGLERPAHLMFLTFDVQREGKRYFIDVSSKESIREPFLDFLIEVEWRSGRILREYTLLLDPPELTRSRAPAVRTPAAAETERTAARERAASSRPDSRQASTAPLEYGPVHRNETLWSIAKEMRPRGYSIPQVMMALVRQNPEAFYEGNVHRLKSGHVLRIEERADIGAMGKAAAAREVQRHTREWEDYKRRAAAEAGRRSPTQAAQVAPSSASSERSRLQLVAPEKQKTDASSEPAASSAKPVVEAKADENTAPSAALQELQRELMLAQEATAAQRRENQELKQRLDELENQLSSMQRLLSLKDDDLATLQQQLAGQSAAADAVADAGENVEVVGDAPPTAEAAAEGIQPDAQTAADIVAQAKQQADAAAEAAATAEAQQAAPKVEPLRPRAEPAPLVPPKASPEPGIVPFVLGLLEDPVVAGGLSGVALILLLLVWLIIRRRKAADFQESILQGGTSSMLATEQGGASGDSSFLSDLAVSDMGAIQADDSEVDPLTEADVYMAYGRHRQAEELLQEAIAAQPERDELLVKLLELYYTTKNKAGFEREAATAFSRLDGAGPLWAKVQAMGHELAPDNPMFGSAPQGAPEIEMPSSPPLSEDEVLDIGLDLDELASEMEPSDEETRAAGALGDDAGDDLDLGLPEMGEPGGAESGPAADATDFSRDLEELDLDGLGLPEETLADEEAPTPSPAADDGSSFEAEARAEEGEDDHLLDFDLSSFDLPDEEPAEETSAGVDDEHAMDFDLGDLDLDQAAEAADAEPDLQMVGLDFDSLDVDVSDSEAAAPTRTEQTAEEVESGPAPSASTAGAEQSRNEAAQEDEQWDALDLDFDLDADAELAGPADADGANATAEQDLAADDFDLDFDLDLDSETASGDAPAAVKSSAEAEGFASAESGLDLDLGMDGADLEPAGDAGEAAVIADATDASLPDEAPPAGGAAEFDAGDMISADLAGFGDEADTTGAPEADQDLSAPGTDDIEAPPEAAEMAEAVAESPAEGLTGSPDFTGVDEAEVPDEPMPGQEGAEEEWDFDLDLDADLPAAEDSPAIEALDDTPAADLSQPEGEAFSAASADAAPEEGEREIPEPPYGEQAADDGFDDVLQDIDFDREDAGGPTGEPDSVATPEAAPVEAPVFDIDAPAEEADPAISPAPSAQDEGPESGITADDDIDLDLDVFEAGAGDEAPVVREPDADRLEDLELEMDLEAVRSSANESDVHGAADAAAESGDEDDEWLSELDEVGTKLDLARAYIDMGDIDGARAILDEVITEGTDDQALQARNLLKEIA